MTEWVEFDDQAELFILKAINSNDLELKLRDLKIDLLVNDAESHSPIFRYQEGEDFKELWFSDNKTEYDAEENFNKRRYCKYCNHEKTEIDEKEFWNTYLKWCNEN